MIRSTVSNGGSAESSGKIACIHCEIKNDEGEWKVMSLIGCFAGKHPSG